MVLKKGIWKWLRSFTLRLEKVSWVALFHTTIWMYCLLHFSIVGVGESFSFISIMSLIAFDFCIWPISSKIVVIFGFHSLECFSMTFNFRSEILVLRSRIKTLSQTVRNLITLLFFVNKLSFFTDIRSFLSTALLVTSDKPSYSGVVLIIKRVILESSPVFYCTFYQARISRTRRYVLEITDVK